MLEVVTG